MGNGDSNGKKKDPMDELYDASFEFRMQSKQLEKEANKVAQKAAAQKNQIKAYMNKGDMESAKIYAGEAIRLQKESNNILRMSGKMGAVSAKLDQARRTQ